MPPRVHPTAIVEPGAVLADNATLGSYTHICKHAVVGTETVIDGMLILPSHVIVESGVRIGVGVRFVAPGSPEAATRVHAGAQIGAGAIIHAGVTIGTQAVVAPGSIVQRAIPSMAIVEGAPTRIVGYVGVQPAIASARPEAGKTIEFSSVRGVALHRLPRVEDIRGNLTVGEFNRSIPFDVKRYFMVFDVPSIETRGEHAHRECHQFLVCAHGRCTVVADDGFNRQEFQLNSPDIGLHLPPLVWGIQYNYSADAVLLVLASHYYDSRDYIRDYAEFKRTTVGETS